MKLRLRTYLLVLFGVLALGLAQTSSLPLVIASPGGIYLNNQVLPGVLESTFQPVQTVWQDDPLYPNDMQFLGQDPDGNWFWQANFPMVLGKNTFLFGALLDVDRDRGTINLNISDLNPPDGVDTFQVEIRVWPPGGASGKVIYLSEVETIPRMGRIDLSLQAPLPFPPFVFDAGTGWYEIRLRTVTTPSTNQIIVRVKVVDTMALTLAFVNLDICDPLPKPLPFVTPGGDFLETAIRGLSFVKGVFPVAEDEIHANYPGQPLWYSPPQTPQQAQVLFDTIFLDLAKYAIGAGGPAHDFRVVGLVPSFHNQVPITTWDGHHLGVAYDSPGWSDPIAGSCFAEVGYWTSVAHELAHLYGFTEVRAADHITPPVLGNGYWVNQKLPRDAIPTLMWAHDGWPGDPNGNADWLVDGQPTYKNDAVRFIDKGDYEHLLNSHLKIGADPEALFVFGIILRNGTVALDPWWHLPDAPLDLEPPSTGNYSIALLDAVGQTLTQVGFNMTFTLHGDRVEPLELDSRPFAFTIPWIEGTRRIQIRDATEHILVERVVSQNSPIVGVNFPNGGEVLTPDRLYTITWNASDLDGDPLTSNVLYSNDGGANWMPLATSLNDTSYTWNVTGFPEGNNYLVKVIASDGVNVGEDTSDGNFAITLARAPRFDFVDTTAVTELEITDLFSENITANGPTNTSRSQPYDPGDGRMKIDTEIVSMNLVGTSTYLGPVTIIESPSKTSNATIQQKIAGVDFPADSFFDLFVEIGTTLAYPLRVLHTDDPILMNATINWIPPWGSNYTSSPDPVPLKNEQDNVIGFIKRFSVRMLGHDTATTEALASKTVVAQGFSLNVSATVANVGNYEEAFNVTAYYGNGTLMPGQWDAFWSMGDCNRDGYVNGTDADIIVANFGWTGPPGGNLADTNSDGKVDMSDATTCANNQGRKIWKYFLSGDAIGTRAVVNLHSGNSASLTFTWNTTGIAYGNYTLSAYAWPVPGETDTSDNNLIGGTVHVGVPGNVNYFNGSRMVDMIDLWLIQGKYGTIIGDPRYVPNYDVNGNGKIDMIDLWITQKHFGQIEP